MPDRKRVLLALWGNFIAPRFDLSTEIILLSLRDRQIEEQRVLVLPQASAEELCQFILKEQIQIVICGGIEEEFLKYLEWKKIMVIDNVVGTAENVINSFISGELRKGDILIHR